MRALTTYLGLIFLMTVVMGAWVNDTTARHCAATTGKTYEQCNP